MGNFLTLKRALTSDPVLCLFDQSAATIFHIDTIESWSWCCYATRNLAWRSRFLRQSHDACCREELYLNRTGVTCCYLDSAKIPPISRRAQVYSHYWPWRTVLAIIAKNLSDRLGHWIIRFAGVWFRYYVQVWKEPPYSYISLLFSKHHDSTSPSRTNAHLEPS